MGLKFCWHLWRPLYIENSVWAYSNSMLRGRQRCQQYLGLRYYNFQKKSSTQNFEGVQNIDYLLQRYALRIYFWMIWHNQIWGHFDLWQVRWLRSHQLSTLYFTRTRCNGTYKFIYIFINRLQTFELETFEKLASVSYKPYLYSRIPNSSTDQLFVHMMFWLKGCQPGLWLIYWDYLWCFIFCGQKTTTCRYFS